MFDTLTPTQRLEVAPAELRLRARAIRHAADAIIAGEVGVAAALREQAAQLEAIAASVEVALALADADALDAAGTPAPAATGYVPGTPPDVVVRTIADAFRLALACCDEDDRNGNLPELIRAALETVAAERGAGTYGLVEHRPGSWEATHITALAAMADWPADQ